MTDRSYNWKPRNIVCFYLRMNFLKKWRIIKFVNEILVISSLNIKSKEIIHNENVSFVNYWIIYEIIFYKGFLSRG